MAVRAAVVHTMDFMFRWKLLENGESGRMVVETLRSFAAGDKGGLGEGVLMGLYVYRSGRVPGRSEPEFWEAVTPFFFLILHFRLRTVHPGSELHRERRCGDG